jgi:hypothetical protein
VASADEAAGAGETGDGQPGGPVRYRYGPSRVAARTVHLVEMASSDALCGVAVPASLRSDTWPERATLCPRCRVRRNRERA